MYLSIWQTLTYLMYPFHTCLKQIHLFEEIQLLPRTKQIYILHASHGKLFFFEVSILHGEIKWSSKAGELQLDQDIQETACEQPKAAGTDQELNGRAGKKRVFKTPRDAKLKWESVLTWTHSLSDPEQNSVIQSPRIPLLPAVNYENHWPSTPFSCTTHQPTRGQQTTAATGCTAQATDTCKSSYQITWHLILISAPCDSSQKTAYNYYTHTHP